MKHIQTYENYIDNLDENFIDNIKFFVKSKLGLNKQEIAKEDESINGKLNTLDRKLEELIDKRKNAEQQERFDIDYNIRELKSNRVKLQSLLNKANIAKSTIEKDKKGNETLKKPSKEELADIKKKEEARKMNLRKRKIAIQNNIKKLEAKKAEYKDSDDKEEIDIEIKELRQTLAEIKI